MRRVIISLNIQYEGVWQPKYWRISLDCERGEWMYKYRKEHVAKKQTCAPIEAPLDDDGARWDSSHMGSQINHGWARLRKWSETWVSKSQKIVELWHFDMWTNDHRSLTSAELLVQSPTAHRTTSSAETRSDISSLVGLRHAEARLLPIKPGRLSPAAYVSVVECVLTPSIGFTGYHALNNLQRLLFNEHIYPQQSEMTRSHTLA
jgi:hypothetical protein